MKGVLDQHIDIRLNWGAFDNATHAPKIRSDNCYI